MEDSVIQFQKRIDEQLSQNRGKNLFNDTALREFVMLESATKIDDVTRLQNCEIESVLIDYTTDKVLEEFCRINQYFSFTETSIKKLRALYSDLYKNLKNAKLPIEEVAKNHYQNLKQWLLQNNSFAKEMYEHADIVLNPVPCSEYSAELQIDLLRIDLQNIQEPILDIGCGKEARVVTYLHNMGFDVCGIDRFSSSYEYILRADWLEFNYGINKWGTIISNLGFSNHFKHHHVRSDGNFIEYAKTYMKILASLKQGGTFYYAPSLPFIEQYIDTTSYSISKYKIGESDFESVAIVKL